MGASVGYCVLDLSARWRTPNFRQLNSFTTNRHTCCYGNTISPFCPELCTSSTNCTCEGVTYMISCKDDCVSAISIRFCNRAIWGKGKGPSGVPRQNKSASRAKCPSGWLRQNKSHTAMTKAGSAQLSPTISTRHRTWWQHMDDELCVTGCFAVDSHGTMVLIAQSVTHNGI